MVALVRRASSGRAVLGWLVVFALGVLLGTALIQKKDAAVLSEPVATSEKVSEKSGVEKALTSSMDVGGADIVAEDIELVQGAEGRIDWKILARVARYSQEKDVVFIVRPQLFAYIGENRDEVFIRAETGEVDQKTDNFRLRENVVGRYGLFALKADEMDYIGAMDKVFLKGKVAVYRPDVDVRATAIEIDVRSREMIAAGGVTATLRPGVVDDKHLQRLGLLKPVKE
jgi:LPS export ABC transporter protein LptC